MANEAKHHLKVFLCHASGDKPAVRALYKRFTQEGINAWLDQENLLPGQDWRVEIPKAVKESDVVVVCLSNKSINKEGFVQKEIEFALNIASEKPEGTIFLIPARLEECEVPARLSRWQWVDLFSENGYEHLMRSLRVRAAKLGVPLESPLYIDKEEFNQRIDQLYAEGVAAVWMEEWDKACYRFQTILDEQPDHKDAATKLEEAKRQKYLNDLYNQALDAQKSENWQAAIERLEKLTNEVPSYKDAPLLLKNAQKKNHMARLYEEARNLSKAQQWQAVVRVFTQIVGLEPDYKDPDNLLSSAEKKVAEIKRLNELNALYRHAVSEIGSHHWPEALDLLKKIQETEPDFLETKRLLVKVEAEVKKADEEKQREIQIRMLYEQAHRAFASRSWQEALNKINEIRRLDEQFTDPDQIANQAQMELKREQENIERSKKLATMYREAVGLLREKKYQNALEKWQEIITLEPKYPDPQKVEATSKRELGKLTKTNLRGINVKQLVIVSFFMIVTVFLIWGAFKVLPLFLVPRGWDFNDSTEGWSSSPDNNKISSLEAINGNLTFDIRGNGAYIDSPNLKINASETPTIYLRMSLEGASGLSGAIYFLTDKDSTWSIEKKYAFLISNGLRDYELPMSSVKSWKDTITQLRIYPMEQSPVRNIHVEINYISLRAP